jgi:hypothetical protein
MDISHYPCRRKAADCSKIKDVPVWFSIRTAVSSEHGICKYAPLCASFLGCNSQETTEYRTLWTAPSETMEMTILECVRSTKYHRRSAVAMSLAGCISDHSRLPLLYVAGNILRRPLPIIRNCCISPGCLERSVSWTDAKRRQCCFCCPPVD